MMLSSSATRMRIALIGLPSQSGPLRHETIEQVVLIRLEPGNDRDDLVSLGAPLSA